MLIMRPLLHRWLELRELNANFAFAASLLSVGAHAALLVELAHAATELGGERERKEV